MWEGPESQAGISQAWDPRATGPHSMPSSDPASPTALSLAPLRKTPYFLVSAALLSPSPRPHAQDTRPSQVVPRDKLAEPQPRSVPLGPPAQVCLRQGTYLASREYFTLPCCSPAAGVAFPRMVVSRSPSSPSSSSSSLCSRSAFQPVGAFSRKPSGGVSHCHTHRAPSWLSVYNCKGKHTGGRGSPSPLATPTAGSVTRALSRPHPFCQSPCAPGQATPHRQPTATADFPADRGSSRRAQHPTHGCNPGCYGSGVLVQGRTSKLLHSKKQATMASLCPPSA